ncbi:hypothetical protein ACKWTF_008386 [Chironomus riparius]
MISKSYWTSLMLSLIVGFLDICQGSSNLSESSLSTQSTFLSIPNDSSTESNLECRNTKGQLVQNGIEFVPKGVDPCRLCICEDNLAKNCHRVLCTPPPCDHIQIGRNCCEFTCLDEFGNSVDENSSPVNNNSNTLKVSLTFISLVSSLQIFSSIIQI